MQAVWLKVTAHRAKGGSLETIEREVVRVCRESADGLLDRLAEIIAESMVKSGVTENHYSEP
jgi:hypothetical protein